MKNIFVLSGISRPNSYTKKLLDIFLNEMSSSYNYELFDTYKENVTPCTGCGFCKTHNTCIYNDYKKVDKGFRTSDILVIATPVFNLSFPAPLKATLDRTQIYYSDRFIRQIKPPILKHKESVLIVSCGSNDQDGIQIITKQIERIFTIINATLSHTVCLTNTDNNPDIKSVVHNIKHIASRLKNIQ